MAALFIGAATAWSCLHCAAIAQEGSSGPDGSKAAVNETRLIDQDPFDLLVLKDKARTTEKLIPLKLPGRRLPPAPRPDETLRIRLRREPEQEYEVRWGDVAEIKLFEHLLLAEARRLTDLGRFDEAFEYLVRLRHEPIVLPELEDAEEAFVVAETKAMLLRDQWENALAGCRRLQELNPRRSELADLWASATEGVVNARLARGQLAAARLGIDQLASKFPNHPACTRMRDAVARDSQARIERAQRALAAEQFTEAQQLLAAAIQLTPDSMKALDLYRQAVEAYPRVVVGVGQSPGELKTPSIGWAEQRIRRLLRPPAVDCIVGTGDAPTVRYVAGWAAWNVDESDPHVVRLKFVRPSIGFSAYEAATAVSQSVRHGSVAYRPDLAASAVELRPTDATALEVRLGRIHPRPEALLGAVLDESPSIDVPGAFRRSDPKPGDAVYVFGDRRTESSPTVAEIVERRFADEDEAVDALLEGAVDVVDRIAPWHVGDLRTRKGVTLVRYAVPSVHLLRPNTLSGACASDELRRALLYAIDRESIVRHHLQVPADDRSSRVASGVFAVGRTTEDPLGYAGATTLPARPYDPQRAFVLSRLALGADPAKSESADAAPTLTLSHPPGAGVVRACERIRAQLAQIGIGVELRERSAESTPDDADLSYVVIRSIEPLVDAPRWFSSGGPLELPGAAAQDALRRLARAESFAAARTALAELQRFVHEEALLLPLWQLNEYAAHRSRITLGPATSAPTSLYQYVDAWRVAPQVSFPMP